MARKLTKFEKFGLIGATLVGVLYFYLGHLYDPQAQALERAREALSRVQREMSELQQLPSAEELRAELESSTLMLADLDAELEALRPHEDDQRNSQLTAQLWVFRQISMHNLRLLEVRATDVSGDIYRWHRYKLHLEGDFRGLLSWLHTLGKYTRPITVEALEMEGALVRWPLQIRLDLLIME